MTMILMIYIHKVRDIEYCYTHHMIMIIFTKLVFCENDSFCVKLVKSLLLIGSQQICQWLLSFIIEKRALRNGVPGQLISN